MYAVTGASGRLGTLVLQTLLEKTSIKNVVALTRTPDQLTHLADRGLVVREFDFDKPESLLPALQGVTRLLLISGSAIGKRPEQHRAVIKAAEKAGVTFIAYTSVLHADTCTLGLAKEHRATEDDIRSSGLNYAILRHGWYTENLLGGITQQIQEGKVVGCAGNGRQSSTARADYATGDALVLLDTSVSMATYEFAGDNAFTMSEYATALTELSGVTVHYVNMSTEEYKEYLKRQGLAPRIADLLADAGAQCALDVMLDDSGTLGKVIGRPTTELRTIVARHIPSSTSSESDSHASNVFHED